MVYEKVDLDQDQRLVLWGVSRTRKTRKERDFRWRDVQRRMACRNIDVLTVLKRLERIGLTEHRSLDQEWWRMTHLGKLIEHDIEKEFLKVEYPDLSRIIRL
jgi:hypothetical protein